MQVMIIPSCDCTVVMKMASPFLEIQNLNLFATNFAINSNAKTLLAKKKVVIHSEKLEHYIHLDKVLVAVLKNKYSKLKL